MVTDYKIVQHDSILNRSTELHSFVHEASSLIKLFNYNGLDRWCTMRLQSHWRIIDKCLFLNMDYEPICKMIWDVENIGSFTIISCTGGNTRYLLLTRLMSE